MGLARDLYGRLVHLQFHLIRVVHASERVTWLRETHQSRLAIEGCVWATLASLTRHSISLARAHGGSLLIAADCVKLGYLHLRRLDFAITDRSHPLELGLESQLHLFEPRQFLVAGARLESWIRRMQGAASMQW